MTRADELRTLADQVEQLEALTAAYTAAQDAVRVRPDDPDVRLRYREAAVALDQTRAAMRRAEGRTGITVGADMIRSES